MNSSWLNVSTGQSSTALLQPKHGQLLFFHLLDSRFQHLTRLSQEGSGAVDIDCAERPTCPSQARTPSGMLRWASRSAIKMACSHVAGSAERRESGAVHVLYELAWAEGAVCGAELRLLHEEAADGELSTSLNCDALERSHRQQKKLKRC